MAITPPSERIWWKEPIAKIELVWIIVAFIWGLVMFFMMIYWHGAGEQNLSSEAYKTTPVKFSQKAQTMIDEYTVRQEGNFPVVRPPPGSGVRRADVCDPASLDAIFSDVQVDAVIHAAAVSGGGGPAAEDLIWRANVVGTRELLDAARRHGVSRFLFLSSEAVYGAPVASAPSERVREEYPLRGEGLYAKSKIQAEAECMSFVRSNSLEVTICRLGSLYGSTERVTKHRPRMSAPASLAALVHDRDVVRFAGSSVGRSYCHVSDAARALVSLVELERPPSVVNLGGARRLELGELVEQLRVLCPRTRFESHDEESSDEPDFRMRDQDERPLLDTTRLTSAIGPLGLRPIDQGLRDLVDGWRPGSAGEPFGTR